MNKLFYNNTFISSQNFNFSFDDRAARYGDGIFETMIYLGNHVRLWNYHYERLEKGMKLLLMDVPVDFKKNIHTNIFQVIKENKLQNSVVKIRIQIWRESGGLYTPLSNKFNFLIETSKATLPNFEFIHLEVSEKSILSYSPFSELKTCNSIPYVVASIEKKNRNVDELILLNTDSEITEATSSNIFWYKNDSWYTPSLLTGCLSGTMRRFCLEEIKKVKEVNVQKKELENAEAAFLCNAVGIRPIKSFLNSKFDTSNEHYTFIKNLSNKITLISF